MKKFGHLVEDVGSLLTDGKYDLENYVDYEFIKVTAKPQESVPLSMMVKSENPMMTKVVLALASIGQELDFCIQEAKREFFDQFMFYGEGLEETDEAEAMKCVARYVEKLDKLNAFLKCLKRFARMLPTIHKASTFIDHCNDVVLNVIHQLSSLRDPKATSGAASFAASPEVHVQVIYDKLAKLLSVLVIIDGIILGHENLRGHWATYRRYIKAAISNPDQYKVGKESMEHLEKMLDPAEAKVIDGNLLKTCLDQDFDKKGFFVTKNVNFGEELVFAIKTLMAEIEGDLSSATASTATSVMFSQELGGASDNRLKLVGLFCLIALHNRLYHSIDRKVLSKMWELCKKVKFN